VEFGETLEQGGPGLTSAAADGTPIEDVGYRGLDGFVASLGTTTMEAYAEAVEGQLPSAAFSGLPSSRRELRSVSFGRTKLQAIS
jgi:hypothetical protein